MGCYLRCEICVCYDGNELPRLIAGSFGEPSASSLLVRCPKKRQERLTTEYRGMLPNKSKNVQGGFSETFLKTFPKTKNVWKSPGELF